MDDDLDRQQPLDARSGSTTPGAATGAPDLASVWRTLVEDLPPSQRAWLAASSPVTLHEHTAIIAVADEFTRSQLEGRLRTRLEDALGHAFGTHVRIAVTVDPDLEAGPSGLTGSANGRSAMGGPSRSTADGSEARAGDGVGEHDGYSSTSRQDAMSTNPLDVPTPLSADPARKPGGGNVLETRLNPK